jgi:hypothetical protein
MAGLEVVVRPVVFPDIRPAPPRSLPAADDPTKGFAVIRGNGARAISLSNSWSSSVTSGQAKEIKRRVDVARVYQKTDDGKVNKDNFVDIEVANRIWMEGPSGQSPDTSKADDKFADVSTRITNRPERLIENYQRVKEQDNIEVKKRDVIKQSDDAH